MLFNFHVSTLSKVSVAKRRNQFWAFISAKCDAIRFVEFDKARHAEEK